MVVFEKKSQCSATPSMILNMKNITRCDKFIPKLVSYYLVYCTYLCKQTGAASCVRQVFETPVQVQLYTFAFSNSNILLY